MAEQLYPQVHRLRCQRAPPGKCKQLARQCSPAIDRLPHAVENPAAPIGIHRLVEQEHPARKRHEQVVEIVCNASCELPDGLHFLGLPQCAFGLGEPIVVGKTLRHVLDELVCADPPAFVVQERVEFHFVIARVAFRQIQPHDLGELLASQCAGPDGLRNRQVVPVILQQFKQGVPDFGAHPEYALELPRARTVDRDEPELEIEYLHEGIGGFHDVGEELLFGNRCVHAGLERRVQLCKRFEPRPGFVLPPPATKGRLHEADERGRVERPLEERDIAK